MEEQLDFFDKPKEENKKPVDTVLPASNIEEKPKPRAKEEEETIECAQCEIYGPIGCPRHRKK